MEFEDWLVSQGLSESTVKKYAGAIDGALTDWGTARAIIKKPIRTIHDSEEFAAFSELIEGTDIFSERNVRGNHMYGAALKNYARYLAALSLKNEKLPERTFGRELTIIESVESDIPPFEPRGQEDGRERILREVVRRQGQPQFRRKLIAAYDSRCAVTRCALLVVLEAAHITPYLGPATNLVSNGLLLRADLHTLWDLALIAVDPGSMVLAVCAAVDDPAYQALAGTRIYQPLEVDQRASIAALRHQWTTFCRLHKIAR